MVFVSWRVCQLVCWCFCYMKLLFAGKEAGHALEPSSSLFGRLWHGSMRPAKEVPGKDKETEEAQQAQ